MIKSSSAGKRAKQRSPILGDSLEKGVAQGVQQSATATPQVQKLQDKVRLLGEPVKTGFDSRGLEEELRAVGWKLQQDLSAKEIEETYFRGCADGLRPGKYLHLALTVLPDKTGIHSR